MNPPGRIDSTSIKKEFDSCSLKKETSVDEAARKIQKGTTNNELTEMLSIFKQFLAFAKGEDKGSRRQDPGELEARSYRNSPLLCG